MDSINGHSKACCNTPPIRDVTWNYEMTGKYETIGGLKTYVTGASTAKNAILVVYDVFGYYPQTIQGADILAAADYQVFMPDFFEGEPCDLAWYPPDNEDKRKSLMDWFGTRGPQTGVDKIPKIMADIEAAYGKKTWVGLGYCWGGKVMAMMSREDTPFKVVAQCHPGMIDPEDAGKITIPFCMLASGEEDPKEVESFDNALTVEKHVETYQDQLHGWMSARGDLAKEDVKKEYERGYKSVLDFFGRHIEAQTARKSNM